MHKTGPVSDVKDASYKCLPRISCIFLHSSSDVMVDWFVDIYCFVFGTYRGYVWGVTALSNVTFCSGERLFVYNAFWSFPAA
ncbi:unnamed protein product [Ectocarpus sp. 8 AP-2014]